VDIYFAQAKNISTDVPQISASKNIGRSLLKMLVAAPFILEAAFHTCASKLLKKTSYFIEILQRWDCSNEIRTKLEIYKNKT
jgi:hypothetical protein